MKCLGNGGILWKKLNSICGDYFRKKLIREYCVDIMMSENIVRVKNKGLEVKVPDFQF